MAKKLVGFFQKEELEQMSTDLPSLTQQVDSSQFDLILGDCLDISKNFEDNFFDIILLYAVIEHIAPENRKVFIDTISKKRKTESIKGFTIEQIVELITKKFTFNDLWFDEKKDKPEKYIKVLIRTPDYTAIGFWTGDSWRIWNHNSSEETSVIAWTELPTYEGLF